MSINNELLFNNQVYKLQDVKSSIQVELSGRIRACCYKGATEPVVPHPTPATTQVPPHQSHIDQPIIIKPLPHHYVRRKHKTTPLNLVFVESQPLNPPVGQSSQENFQREPTELSHRFDEVITRDEGDHSRRTQATASVHSEEQVSMNIIKTQLEATTAGVLLLKYLLQLVPAKNTWGR